MTIQCNVCRFYLPIINHRGNLATRGECRRRPPVMPEGDSEDWTPTGYFPVVDEDDWCGEFAPRAATLPHGRDDEANAAFDAASQHDAADAAVSANGCGCERLPELSPARGV